MGMVTTFRAGGSHGLSPVPAVSRQTRVNRRNQRIGIIGLWVSSGITILVLFTIIGYILVNGLYKRQRSLETLLPAGAAMVPLADGTEVSVLVNRRVRVDELRFDELSTFFGPPAISIRPHKWTDVSHRQLDVELLVAEDVAESVLAEFTPQGQEPWSQIERLPGDEIVDRVAAGEGAVAVVRAGTEVTARGVDLVPLRYLTVVVSADVAGIYENFQLQHLTVEQLGSLLTGEIDNWSELGVRNSIDVSPVLVDPAGPVGRPILETAFGEDRLPTGTSETTAVPTAAEALALAASRSGAVTVVPVQAYEAFVESTPGAEAVLRQFRVERISRGVNLRPAFFVEPPAAGGEAGGVSTIMVNTIIMIVMTLLVATPLGIAAAVYLAEYAKQGTLVRILRLGTNTLAGIPSIVFGLFGMVLFVEMLNLGTGLISGVLTITLMILPTIVNVSEDAIRSVPRELREGSLALGATRLQTIVRVVLPAASPGILTSVILAIGRAVGETAALIYTMGAGMDLVKSLKTPMRTLAVHMYYLAREPKAESLPNAFASATILIIIVVIINYAARRLMRRMSRMAGAR